MTRPTGRRVCVLLFAIGGAACSSSAKSSTPNTTTTATTATTTTSTTIAPPVDISTTVWPTAASTVRFHEPVAAARAFATSYLHFVDPVVGQFRAGDAHSGEVPIRTHGENPTVGPVTTVIVRQLGNDGSWWVLGAATPNIVLTEPAVLTTISSPVRLRGSSTAFEANVQVSIRQDDVTKPLVESAMMGGANGQMGPFDASFRFAAPTSRSGAIVLYTVSSATGNVSEATVIRVRLAAN